MPATMEKSLKHKKTITLEKDIISGLQTFSSPRKYTHFINQAVREKIQKMKQESAISNWIHAIDTIERKKVSRPAPEVIREIREASTK